MKTTTKDGAATVSVKGGKRSALLSLLQTIHSASERNDGPYTTQMKNLVNDLQEGSAITIDDREFARYLQDQLEVSTSPRLSDPVAQQLLSELGQIVPALKQGS